MESIALLVFFITTILIGIRLAIERSKITALGRVIGSLQKEASELHQKNIETLKIVINQKDVIDKLCAEVPRIRSEAIAQSKRVHTGLTYQHLAPFDIDTFDPRDFRFIGDPIDYIILDGLSAVKQGEAQEIKEVILCDIKTGKATLNKNQRKIRDCIDAGRVRFVTLDKKENL